jgi:hypothetical protein
MQKLLAKKKALLENSEMLMIMQVKESYILMLHLRGL